MNGRRILIDGSMARSGGGATYVRNLVPRLAALRPEDRFRLWLREEHLAAALPPLANLEVEVLPEVAWTGRMRFLVLHAAERARRWGADLYFSTAEYAPPRPPCPAIASFRNPNVFSRLDLGWPLRQRARLFVLRRLASHSARVCARILFVSADSAGWIGDEVGLPPERRAVVPHGIDLEAWSRASVAPQRLAGGRPYLLSVSSVYRYKNYVRLIEAWSQVARRRPDAPDLVIIGDEPDRAHRRDMEAARAATGALAQRTHLLGEVPYAEIRGWYAGACGFVFPSFLETFGHPLIEAMAMELPIVAAEIGVFREIAADCVLGADPHDTGALAAAMESLLADPSLARDLAARGRRRAGGFSWDRSARLHADLLSDVLAAP
ncbi:MAG: glycosyltransferase family 1 protein [Deltaproteobacteria bacterium]|nr:glycosyltransferase family 1 protein [Deltaproteobacteria bacterium]